MGTHCVWVFVCTCVGCHTMWVKFQGDQWNSVTTKEQARMSPHMGCVTSEMQFSCMPWAWVMLCTLKNVWRFGLGSSEPLLIRLRFYLVRKTCSTSSIIRSCEQKKHLDFAVWPVYWQSMLERVFAVILNRHVLWIWLNKDNFTPAAEFPKPRPSVASGLGWHHSVDTRLFSIPCF